MNKIVLGVMAAVLAVGVVGCAQKPQSANADEAIKYADQLADVQAKVAYLVKEANAFLSSKNYDQAVSTAKYVLGKLDSNSAEAKGVLTKAEEEIKKLAAQKIDAATAGVKNALGGLGK